MRKATALLAVALMSALVWTATVSASPTAQQRDLQTRAHKHASVVRFFTTHAWMRAPRHATCKGVPWSHDCRIARRLYREHSVALRRAKKQLYSYFPSTNDWRTAVTIAQRAYPGTAGWMLYISRREGGYGQWVWYGHRLWNGYHIGNDYLGADTVGGWMQFRYSTFAPYWRAAEADLNRRGFHVPDFQMPPPGGPTKYAAWLNPLGQALTAGYMRYYGKDGCHWCL